MDWSKDEYLIGCTDRAVRDARQMLDNTAREHWGVSIMHAARGEFADDYFKAYRNRVIRGLADVIVAEDAAGVILGNGTRTMRFDISREYMGERTADATSRAGFAFPAPQVRYRTDYANEVHQLVISVSRHFWVGKDRVIRYQEKPFDVALAKLGRSPKQHLVHYLIRDHFSGLMYAEIGVSETLFSAREFLLRAWSRKDRLSFSGLPHAVTVPKTVQETYHELLPWLDELGVRVIPATSGFQAGVRDLKTWEEHLRYSLDWYPPDDLAHLPALAESICWGLVEEPIHRRQQVERWRANLRAQRYPESDQTLRLIPEEWRTGVYGQYHTWLRRFGRTST